MPEVSVILPVYNGGRFLKEAIDSILNQTFTDFELLIINDGSTDNSEGIIKSYTDVRIVYLKNERNQGLIFSLNRAIDAAKGEFIARMDADDVSLPQRLSRQIEFLQADETIGVVATTIKFIDETKTDTGTWKLDAKTITPSLIRKVMPWECCIAHPTVTGRTALFKKFKYSTKQKNIEDYDLWLRMMTAKIKFGKIPEPLLLYRVHSLSVTQLSRGTIFPKKRILNCKKVYLKQAFTKRRFSRFGLTVLLSMIADLAVVLKKTIFNH